MNSQLQMILQSSVFWRKVCICTRVIALWCTRKWIHAKGWKSEKHASAPPHLICFFLLAGPPPTNSGNKQSVINIRTSVKWHSCSSSPFILLSSLLFSSSLLCFPPFPLKSQSFSLSLSFSRSSFSSQHQDCQGQVAVEFLTWEVQSTAKLRWVPCCPVVSLRFGSRLNVSACKMIVV